MNTQDYDYFLPEDLIAQYPLAKRTASRLLILSKNSGYLKDGVFTDILNLIHPEDLLVFNQTKVMNARLLAHKPTGGQVELLVERVLSKDLALAHMRSSKPPKPGSKIILKNNKADDQSEFFVGADRCVRPLEIEVLEKQGSLVQVKLPSSSPYASWSELLANHGHVPLPPYIERSDDIEDQERYQTVFAKTEGSVAAPTAGLHFDLELIEKLKAKKIAMGYLNLHVGAGTFQPVRTEKIDDHVMHSEYIEVPEDLVEQIKKTKAQGGKIIAVGTTTVRALESAALSGDLKAMSGETTIFIRPGFKFKVIDNLITNFHLPQSTLLMLVSALAGREFILEAYEHAIKNKYRFFSYGDAMWVG